MSKFLISYLSFGFIVWNLNVSTMSPSERSIILFVGIALFILVAIIVSGLLFESKTNFNLTTKEKIKISIILILF